MFERLEISENIYEGIVNPPCKKATREEATSAGHIMNMRGRYIPSNSYPYMGGRTVKRNKMYVDRPIVKLQLICLICGHGHSSEEFKILSDFGKVTPLGGLLKRVSMITLKVYKTRIKWCGTEHSRSDYAGKSRKKVSAKADSNCYFRNKNPDTG